MKIGDEVYVHGYIDEIRNDVIIIRNDGGYFGTVPSEVVEQEETLQNLTKPNKSDLISRQDAIDAWWYDEVFFGNQRDDMTKEQWLDYIADVIGSIPSAQLERKTDGDTVSRQDAIGAVHGSYDEILDFKSTGRTIADSVEDIISNLPSAQVEKAYELGKADRPKGEWIENAQEYYEMINEKGGEKE